MEGRVRFCLNAPRGILCFLTDADEHGPALTTMRLNAPRGILCFLTETIIAQLQRITGKRLNAPRGILCFLTRATIYISDEDIKES